MIESQKGHYGRHKLANPNGGLILKDEGNLAPKAFKEFMSRVAKKIMNAELSDILKTQAPAYIHHPRSYLEGAAYDLSYSPKYLTQAALEQNPVEKLKLIVTMYVAGHHINPSQIQLRAPLNPTTGETVQRVLEDRSKFYGEQVSHHPPITSFLMEGPNNLYRFSGHFEYKAWIAGINSIGGSRIGKQIISFKDGGLITLKDPEMEIKNILSKKTHVMVGKLIITDHINKMIATVTYNPPKSEHGGMLKSLKRKIFKSDNQQPLDWMHIQIEQISINDKKNKAILSEGQGSWLEYIEFDGKVYWTINDEMAKWKLPNEQRLPESLQEYLLPSDSTLRPDYSYLVNKEFDQAEIEKTKLEEQQRKDIALRKKANNIFGNVKS